jgi:hypothetical protein
MFAARVRAFAQLAQHVFGPRSRQDFAQQKIGAHVVFYSTETQKVTRATAVHFFYPLLKSCFALRLHHSHRLLGNFDCSQIKPGFQPGFSPRTHGNDECTSNANKSDN